MEPVLEIDDIQGNIEPGFRMPFQKVYALQLADVHQLAPLLDYLLPKVTTMRQAMHYHQRRVAKAKVMGVFGVKSFQLLGDSGLWLNIHLGRDLLAKAGIADPLMADSSFMAGQYQQSRSLGDPVDPAADGYPANWKIGSANKLSDMFLLLAANSRESLDSGSQSLLSGLMGCCQYSVLYSETAQRPDNDAEHFGFKDGISQPALRGLLQQASLVFYNARTVRTGNDDPATPEFAAPGKLLVWPGQFIFGYPAQSATSYRDAGPIQNSAVLRNGSFLVFRRLRQQVKEFYDWTNTQSTALAALDPQYQNADLLRSKIVGRSKLTADSLLFTGPADVALLNHFQYSAPLGSMTLTDGTVVNSPVSDPLASLCPYFAHIRKVNPRDAPSNRGDGKTTLGLRILRRGIPFGPPYDHTNPANPTNATDRGLLFLSYQTSIRNQFEPLANDWMNSDVNPEGGQGTDLLVGQVHNNGQPTQRSAMLTVNHQQYNLMTMEDFVVPTGGEYFFTPSVSLLKKLATPISAAEPLPYNSGQSVSDAPR